jgi:hypothetical protein
VSAAQHMRSARNALYALFAVVALAMAYVTAPAIHYAQAMPAPLAVASHILN